MAGIALQVRERRRTQPGPAPFNNLWSDLPTYSPPPLRLAVRPVLLPREDEPDEDDPAEDDPLLRPELLLPRYAGWLLPPELPELRPLEYPRPFTTLPCGDESTGVTTMGVGVYPPYHPYPPDPP